RLVSSWSRVCPDLLWRSPGLVCWRLIEVGRRWRAGSMGHFVEVQFGDGAAQACESSLNFCRISEVGPHAPPDPGQSAGQGKALSQFGNYISVAVLLKKSECERQPLPARNKSDHIKEKDEQIICLACCGW